MIKNNSAAILGRNIRTYRQRNGLSIRELAKLCGVSENHLCDIENFKCEVRSDTIDRICVSLGCDWCEIFDPDF